MKVKSEKWNLGDGGSRWARRTLASMRMRSIRSIAQLYFSIPSSPASGRRASTEEPARPPLLDRSAATSSTPRHHSDRSHWLWARRAQDLRGAVDEEGSSEAGGPRASVVSPEAVVEIDSLPAKCSDLQTRNAAARACVCTSSVNSVITHGKNTDQIR